MRKKVWPFALLALVALLAIGIRSLFKSSDQALMEAIDSENVSAVRSLLNAGANSNARGWPTPKTGIVAWYDRMDHPEFYRRTALMLAASQDSPEIVRLLLEKGADFSATSDSKTHSTALTWAASCGRLENVRLLLDAGVDKNRQDVQNAFVAATASGAERGEKQIAILRLLLQRGADVNGKDSYGNTALSIALTSGTENETINFLLQHGSRTNIKNSEGQTALICAVEGGNMVCIQRILTERPDVNARDNRGMTALMYVNTKNAATIIKALVAHRANLNAQDKEGATALMMAAMNNDAATIQALLKMHADVNIREKDGATALTYAEHADNSEIAGLLKKAGAKN